jgi:NO-binding membrane sensor protein with MHYT domain
MHNFLYRFAFVLFAILVNVLPSFADEALNDSVNLTLVISSNNEVNLNSISRAEKGINALEAVSRVVVLGTRDTSYGPMITSLCGVSAIGNTYWALYVDGKMSPIGAHEVIMNDDTFIRLNLESF